MSLSLQLWHYRRQCPLTGLTLFAFLTVDKVLAPLIQGVVSEVHESLVEVLDAGRLVGHCTEPYHSCFAEIDLWWVYARYQDIEPQIKLETLEKEGVGDVFLHDRWQLQVGEIPWVLDEEDALALRPFIGLHNVGRSPALLSSTLDKGCELLLLVWQQPSAREEVVVLGKELSHSIQVFGQLCLV